MKLTVKSVNFEESRLSSVIQMGLIQSAEVAPLVAQTLKNPPAVWEIPGWRRSPGEGNSYPLQYSGLENPMDRGAWEAAVHGAEKIGHD